MEIKFGVAVVPHQNGAGLDALLDDRFDNYRSAFQYGRDIEPACGPTVYVILDEEYAFNCSNIKLVHIYKQEKQGKIQVTYSLAYKDFCKDPYAYLHLNCGKLKPNC